MQKRKLTTILSIDTSCDETSASVTENLKVLSNVIASQVDLHRKWGGVVPTIAKRAHEENIDATVKEALTRSRKSFADLDAVAVTHGPGLAIALEIGIKKAKEICKTHHKPLIPVNHMEGHLLSPLATNSKGTGNDLSLQKGSFPILGFLVSGGHTEIVVVSAIGKYQKIGETIDDAAGEAFDKFAKMLNLGYPGGEIVERLALKGNQKAYTLPRPMANIDNLNYSFSGLKTAALYLIQKLQTTSPNLNKPEICDLCASFQEAVIDSLMIKLRKALNLKNPHYLFCGGGVISNLSLRRQIRHEARLAKIPVFFPRNDRLTTDNAAMIGIAAYFKFQRKEFLLKNFNKLDRQPNLSF